MARKAHEDHANHERWLVSYADFITLLFAFFVVMYAISEVDTKRLKQVVGAIRFATHFEGTGGVGAPPVWEGPVPSQRVVTDVVEGRGDRQAEERRIEVLRLKQEIDHTLREVTGDAGVSEMIEVAVTEEGVRIRLLAAHFFDAGSAVLRPAAIPVVDSIGKVIREIRHPVRVEGHSDDQASKDRLANWRLSSDRALSIVRYLIEGFSVAPRRLSMAAFAQYRPVASNGTPEGRAVNRRIDLFIINQERPPSPVAAPAEGP